MVDCRFEEAQVKRRALPKDLRGDERFVRKTMGQMMNKTRMKSLQYIIISSRGLPS